MGSVLLERPFALYNQLVFHVLRAKLKEYERKFPGRYANVNVCYTVLEGEFVLLDMADRLVDPNDVEREAVVDLLLFVGVFAVQCIQEGGYLLDEIDYVLQKASQLFTENIEQ